MITPETLFFFALFSLCMLGIGYLTGLSKERADQMERWSNYFRKEVNNGRK